MKIVQEVLERALREFLEEDPQSKNDYYIRQRNFNIIEKFIHSKSGGIQDKLMEVL